MSTPLRELLSGILFDGPTRAGFTADPAAFLQDHGWGDLDGADVHDALGALVDDVPLERAAAIAPIADAAPAEAEGLTGAVDGLLLATASVDARFGVVDAEDPAAGLDRADGDGAGDDGLDLDAFDAPHADDPGSATDDDRVAADEGFRVEDLADVDNPEDLDGVTELGELEPLHFDATPELDHLDDLDGLDGLDGLARPFVDHSGAAMDHTSADRAAGHDLTADDLTDTAEPDDLDLD